MYSSVWVFFFCKPLLLWKNTGFLWVEKNIKHVEINVQWRHDFTGVTVMLCLSQSAPVWTQYSQLAGWHRPLSVDEGSTLKLGGVSVCVRTWMCVCVCVEQTPPRSHTSIHQRWLIFVRTQDTHVQLASITYKTATCSQSKGSTNQKHRSRLQHRVVRTPTPHLRSWINCMVFKTRSKYIFLPLLHKSSFQTEARLQFWSDLAAGAIEPRHALDATVDKNFIPTSWSFFL